MKTDAGTRGIEKANNFFKRLKLKFKANEFLRKNSPRNEPKKLLRINEIKIACKEQSRTTPNKKTITMFISAYVTEEIEY